MEDSRFRRSLSEMRSAGSHLRAAGELLLAAMRDSAGTARTQALFAAEEITALTSGFGGLLIAYLIWHPVFTRKPEPQLQ